MWKTLLDTSVPIDLQLLDNAATLMYINQPDNDLIQIVSQTTQREDFFSCIDKIINMDYSKYLKYLALTVFNKFVSNNWGDLPPEDAEYYRNFIAQFITKEFSEENIQLLYIADSILINILLYEWPNQWPDFIGNILSIAKNSPQSCQNSLKVIRMLVQEFTDFSENSMTTVRQAEMHYAFSEQFDSILPIILEALSSENEDLIIESLNDIKTFLNVIDSEKIFTQDMINVLTNEFLPDPKYMIYCISIISIIPTRHAIFDESSFESFVPLFYAAVQCLEQIFVSENMYDIKINAELTVPEFIHIFISSMKKLLRPFVLNAPFIEQSDQFSLCLKWLFNITCQIDMGDPKNAEDFQDLVEFWHTLARSLYFDLNSNRETNSVYYPFFQYLRRFYLCSMVEPIINNTRVDEDGIHYHRYDLTQEANTYNFMRETLVFMYHINPDDSNEAISERLEEIKSSPSIEAINSFAWAIGAIPGTIPESQELTIVSEILQTFMSMVASFSEDEEVSDDKISLICAILHICSQYGQMLSKHYELLKVVLNKMIEFSQEPSQQIQNAAVQALTQIGRYAKNSLATRQQSEEQSFLEMLLSNIQQLLEPLSQDNIISMIEFFSFLITEVGTSQIKKEMTSSLAGIINSKLQESCQNIDLDNPDWFGEFIFIVDCNTQILKYLYLTYSDYFAEIYQEFINVYQQAVERLNSLEDYPDSEPFIAVKKLKCSIIHLFITFIESSNKEKALMSFAENALVNVFINDYANSPVKTPEILGLVSLTCAKLTEFFQTNYDFIMESIITPSLPLMEDPGDFPDIWPEFNKFLATYFQQNLDFLANNGETLMAMYNLLKKSCSHPVQKISDHSLMTLSALISNVGYNQTQSKSEFFNTISIDIFVFITSLLIDGVHKYLFNNIMNLMRRLIQMDQVQSRPAELMEGLCGLLPNRQPKEIRDLIIEMIDLSKSQYSAFKDLIRNFVVMAKKYAPGDPSMYKPDLEECKKQLEQDKQVPGLILDKRAPNQEVDKLAKAFSSFFYRSS